MYKNQLNEFKKKDIRDKQVSKKINEAIKNYQTTKNKAIAYFVKHTKAYLVQEGILLPELLPRKVLRKFP